MLSPRNSKEKDLAEISSLGHFLKGSSATLGLTKVKVSNRHHLVLAQWKPAAKHRPQDSCEKLQHYGQKRDEAGTGEITDEEVCLNKISETLVAVKEEYAEVEKVLRKFYASL